MTLLKTIISASFNFNLHSSFSNCTRVTLQGLMHRSEKVILKRRPLR